MKFFVEYSCCHFDRELLKITSHVYSFKRQLLWNSWRDTRHLFSYQTWAALSCENHKQEFQQARWNGPHQFKIHISLRHTMRWNYLSKLTDDFIWGKTWNHLRQSTFRSLKFYLLDHGILKKIDPYPPLQLPFQCNRMAVKIEHEQRI